MIRSKRITDLLRIDRPFTMEEKMILRDHLALERTRLANERTFLAYTRSSLYLVIGGLALIQLEGDGDLLWVGVLSLVLSVAFVVIGIVRFMGLKHQLKGFYRPFEQVSSGAEKGG